MGPCKDTATLLVLLLLLSRCGLCTRRRSTAKPARVCVCLRARRATIFASTRFLLLCRHCGRLPYEPYTSYERSLRVSTTTVDHALQHGGGKYAFWSRRKIQMFSIIVVAKYVKICFSADGSLLAVACEDKSHTVMVYRWESGLLRYYMLHLLEKHEYSRQVAFKLSTRFPLDIRTCICGTPYLGSMSDVGLPSHVQVLPLPPHAPLPRTRCQASLGVKKALSLCFSLNAGELLAAGHKHFKVWTLSGGGLMQGKRGLFGSGSKVRGEGQSR